MKLKDIKLKKVIEILIITAAVSIMLLGLVVWIFNIPAYFRGEKGAYVMTPENSVSVNVNKTYEIDGITSIDIDLLFSDIDVLVTDDDTISFLYIGSVISKPEFKEPFLVFNKTLGKLQIKTTYSTGYNVANSSVVLKLSIPEGKLKELKLATSSGDITVFGNAAGKMILDTSSGSIAVNGFTGTELICESSSGDQNYIHLEVGKLHLSSSSGDVTIDDSSSDKTVVETSSGGIEIRQFGTKENQIETISGQVNMENYSGNLNFSSSSGALKASFDREGVEIIADTSSGDVTLLFKEDAGFTLKVDTSSGQLRSDFPLTLSGDYDKDKINGSVGDGQRLVKVKTSSGDITINRK